MYDDCKCGHEAWDHKMVDYDPPGYSRDEFNEFKIEGWIEFKACEIAGCSCKEYEEV